MRVESVSVGTKSLQSSENNHRKLAESNTVVQELNVKMKPEPTKKQIETAVEKLNDFVEPLKTSLKFQFHEELNEYYVTVVDPNTDEVIKEIPPKKILDMYAAMGEYMGFLIDKKI
ncbi:flagellar protein FlaG [Ornithinibacillus sp. BX22]|uniref:Flagellar protein FlaG n=2 Tax=Ornithinibacillus TaxID=484508 RepID=A0A923RJE6_9BACI|nr:MULTISPECIES: flagellar protein FlaG [Ornithinibacillus]MBC5637896.1 flagellar protein FlaG [Ornithinibacillus hominis]MBS3681740.1 flagellar protein FlaG [Ornithinibacillus massiliensis]